MKMIEKYVNLLTRAWYASLLNIILISGFVTAIYYIWGFEPSFDNMKSVIFSYGLMLAMVMCVFSAGKSSKRKLSKLKELDLPNKLTKYRTILLKKLLLYSMVSVIAAIGFFVCAEPNYLLFSAISLVLILLSKPTQTKMRIELALSEEEINKIEKLKFEKKI